MKQLRYLLGFSLVGLGLVSWAAPATLQPEPVGRILKLPAAYPDHWVVVHDISFFHMLEGKLVVVDPLGETAGDQIKGMMTASFISAYERNRARGEHYVMESFFARGGRGGERTDVVTIYDSTTLAVAAEVIVPPKRVTGMPKRTISALLQDGRFLAIYNFTPAQSISIVDLAERVYVGEVATPGCGFVMATGPRGFSSICSDGTFLTTFLDAAGARSDSVKSEVVFDPDADPVFEAPMMRDGVAYFVTFQGEVLPVDLRAATPSFGARWALDADAARAGWRPGGSVPMTVDAAGTGYVLMHPGGGEGTHKNPGTEVWRYDLANKTRSKRLTLQQPGLSLATSGTEKRWLFVTNVNMGVDVYDLPSGRYVKTLAIPGDTPLIVHGMQGPGW